MTQQQVKTQSDVTKRLARHVVAVERSSVRYRRRRPDDGLLRERLRALVHQRRRFGYRRLWVLLRRKRHVVNSKWVYRLYRQERLMVRVRRHGEANFPPQRTHAREKVRLPEVARKFGAAAD
jgi:putative transposase